MADSSEYRRGADDFLRRHGPKPNVRTDKVDATDPRLGVPTEKLGIYYVHIMTEDKRHAVICIVIPPEELRDAPREAITHFFQRRAQGLAAAMAEEVYKSYTSDPPDAAAAQNLSDLMAAHARTMRKG